IAPLGVRWNLERLIDGMVEHVEAVEVDAHVLVRTGERLRPIQPEVPEIEPAAHVEQVTHADLSARIAVAAPFLHGRVVVDPHAALPNEDPDERCGDALALGPAD